MSAALDHAPPSPRRRRVAAFTALEVMFSLAILAIVMLGVVAAVSSSGALRQHDRQVGVAIREVTREMERYRGMTPDDIISTIIDQAPVGSPTRVVTSNLGTEEDGTIVLSGGVPTTSLSVSVLKSPTLTVKILTEVEAQAAYGLATTPDFDGDSTGSDFTRYRVAPVEFELRWTNSSGVEEVRRRVTIYYPQTTVGS